MKVSKNIVTKVTELLRSRWLTTLTVVIYVIVLTIFVLYLEPFYSEYSKEQKILQAKKEFFSVSDKIISEAKEDNGLLAIIRIAFNSVDRKYSGLLLAYGFKNTLEDYLINIKKDSNKDNDQFFEKIMTLIKKEEEQEPFSSLPSEQRRIMVNLSKAIESNNQEQASFNLMELNQILRLKYEAFKELKRQNSWAIPLAILGFVITILFGLINILRPISYFMIRKIIREEIISKNEINNGGKT